MDIFHKNISISSRGFCAFCEVVTLLAGQTRQNPKYSKVIRSVWVENDVEATGPQGLVSKTDCYCFIEKFHLWHWANTDESGAATFLNNEYEYLNTSAGPWDGVCWWCSGAWWRVGHVWRKQLASPCHLIANIKLRKLYDICLSPQCHNFVKILFFHIMYTYLHIW